MDDQAPDQTPTPAAAREALPLAVDPLSDAAVLALWALVQAWLAGADEAEC
jgi:hypothetical protein